MTQSSPSTRNSGLRVFSASLLSALMIMMPFVQLAAAQGQRLVVRGQRPESERQAASDGRQDRATNAAAENVFLNAPIPKPAPEPLVGPVMVATKDDGLATATTVAPGGTITYSVNIKNNGTTSPADDATNVQFTDQIDSHTTLVGGSAVAAVSDKYNAIGNVLLTIPDGSTDLLGNDVDPDTGNNTGMTVTAETKSSTQCTGGCSNNVTINADGSFTYDPPVGFSGTDTFTYTAHSTTGPGTATETVTITVANEIWFINNNAGACPGAPCDGRLSHPFTSLAAFTTANDGAAGHPGDNDWIFVYESATDYTGPATLRNGQKFIGQDATASLATLTGFPAPSGTDPLPAMNSGNGTFVNISGTNVNGINLLSGNTLRGFRVGNVGTGTKISGTSFGTLVVGNSGSPDVLLHGTGRALNLTTGTLAVTGGFISVTTTSSASQGISLSGVADSDGAGVGSFSFGSTTVSGSTTQGILIGTTPADLNFGNTSVTGGTDGVSFQNNSGGTRTFGTLGISGGAGAAFLHGAGGGNVTVTGIATLSSTGSAVSVSAPGATNVINFQAATTATSTGAAVTGVNWVGVAGATLTFNSLSITRNNGIALNASGGGTVNVTNGTGSITNTTAGGPAIVAANIALNANFSQINSTGGDNGVSLTTVSGTSSFGGGQLTGTASGSTFLISGGSVSVTYSGNITQAAPAPMVTITGGHSSTGPVTFSGTLNASLGQGLQFNNADSTGGGGYNFTGTTTLAGGDAGIDILNLSAGSFNFGTGTTITSPSGTAFNVGTTPGNPTVTYSGSITQNNAQRVISIDGTTGNTITFQTGTITGGSSSTGIIINNANGNVTFSNGMTLGTNVARMTNQALTITNGTGTYNLGAVSIFTNNAQGIVATGADGTINSPSGTVDTTNNRAINIDGPGGLTTLGMTLTTVNSSAGTNGIAILDTNGSFTLAGTVTGSDRCGGLVTVNAVGTPATVTAPVTSECTGGTIQNSTGAGVLINNATNISLSRLRILNPATDGLDINTITGFTLNKSYISDSAGVAGDKGVDINFASGTAVNGTISFTNSYIGPTPHDNFGVTISSGTSTWNLTGIVFDDSQLNSGFNFEIRGSSTVSSFTMDGCVLQNQFADGMQMQPNASATATITVANIQNNTFQNNNLGLDLNHDGTANVTYRVINNTFRTHESHAINFFSSAVQAPTTGGTLNGRFEGNAIGTALTNDSGSRIGNGLRVNINGGADSTVTIHNNTIRQTPNGRGIEIISRNGTGGLDATLTNNNVDVNFRVTPENAGFSLAAIFLQSNCLAVCNTLRADIRGNIVPVAPPNGELQNFQITLIETGASTFQLVDNSPASANATAELTELHTNPAHNNVGSAGASAGVALIAGPINTVAMFKPENLNRGYEVAKMDSPTTETSEAARLDASGLVSSTVTSFGRVAEVTVPVALAKLTSESAITSSSTNALTKLSKPSVVGSQHATSEGSEGQRSEIRTHHASSSKLETRNTRRDEETGLRAHYATLSKLATRSATTPNAAMAGETVTANIGTLPAGASVTITFQVTVNNPPNLTLLGPPRVENQGTVSGSNFVSVLTDDPNVVGAADKTATQIDLYGTTTTVQTSGTPSDEGDPVTFTATVAPNNLPFAPPGGTIPTGTVQFLDGATPITCNEGSTSIQTLNGSSQATCTTSTLTSGAHTINVNYSGDGNFDSGSGNVSQTVNPCTQNPVVTNTADSGAGSLREALATVCSAPNNNITFNIPIADPGFVGGVYTITVLTELTVTKNVNITGPNSVTNTNPIVISGNNATRVFKINSGKTVTMTGFTVTGGSVVGSGGGIFNDHGTLTLTNVTVSGNTGGAGGGIYVDGSTSGSASLTVISSTISGNSSTVSGGGIYVNGLGGGAATLVMTNSTVSGNNAAVHGGGVAATASTTSTLTNVTVTDNRADNDNNATGGGGGIASFGTMTLSNTILAANFNEDGVTDAPDDANGSTFEAASSYNLVGNGDGTTGITNGTNGNQVGTTASPINPVIGPLANNGGPTFTHRILGNSSPAMDQGITALTTDQRGQPRPKDNLSVPNVAGGDGDDIGAYEAPLPPNAPDLDAASDTGASSTDNYTSDNTPTFTIQGVENGAFVELLADATVVASGTAVGTSIQLTSSVLADGPYSMTARQTVGGGLSPTSTGLNVTIDTGVPGTPTIDLQAGSDSGSSNSDNITNAATRTFDIGNTETGATVELLRDGVPVVGSSTTGNGGTVQLSDSDALVSGTTYAYTARQTDGGGNQATSAAVNVTFDNVGPTVSMSSVAPNPTNTSPIPVSVLFNESVTGFTAADITPGNATVSNFAGSGANYTFDLVPSGQGTVTADISAAVAQDTAGNDNTAATQFSRTFDSDAPTANITDVTPDPRNNSVSTITIVFTEAVTGFDMADLTLTRDGGANLLTGAQTLSSGDGGITWTLGNLSGITGTGGTYLLTLTAAGSGITDNAGNALAGDATDSWVVDTTAPTVTINQAAGQADPTSSSPINFTVVFSEPVTGFTNTDVTFSGAGATTATVTEVAPNDGTTYNVAISGMNANGTVQADVNVNAAQDAVGNNSAASTSTDNQVTFINAITININDAKVTEPASPNTVDMTFTVSLSAPAPVGGVTVNFTTNDGSATFGACGNPGADYVSTSGQVAFTVGQQVKTINVPVCSDAVAEGDETFTVTLSSPTSPGVIGDGTATGTITAANPAGEVLISEIRTTGPGGAGDDFVELYNNSNSPKDISGYGLFKKGADCHIDSPVLIAAIPGAPGSNTTVIPARGHYLLVGSQYSLSSHPGGNNGVVATTATGDQTLTADIETDANVGLFSTADPTTISTLNRVDAVGFGLNTGGTCNLLREGSTLPPIASDPMIEHSYFRKMCDWIQGSGCTVPGIPKDTNQNADDFWLADTAASAITGRLGAPGPENLTSPIRRDSAGNPGSGGINMVVLDGTVGAGAQPNRQRDGSDPPSTFGSMTLRYRVTNNTAGPVTRLRYRIVDISTAIQPAGPTADLRALTSSTHTAGPVGDPVTCTVGGQPVPPPSCSVQVQGTTLETPPVQAPPTGIGGGYNSTLSSGTVTTTTPLAPGSSILINFKLGVEKTGAFRFYIIIEALP